VKDLTTPEIMERIVSCAAYQRGDDMTNALIKALFKNTRAARGKMDQAKHHLVKEGKLVKIRDGLYKKPIDTRKWLTMPWRKITNEQLGIEA
jgi:hypothetical protein